MKKKQKKIVIPDFTEFTDDDGKKWVQTSTEDLFSMQEFNDILQSIEKEKESGEIVLARIDFQKVNKEYYDTVMTLQDKLQKQTELLKKVITQSSGIIDKKNKKLKELIEYIKKLHIFLAYINANKEKLEKGELPMNIILQQTKETEEVTKSEYEEVDEIELTREEDIKKK